MPGGRGRGEDSGAPWAGACGQHGGGAARRDGAGGVQVALEAGTQPDVAGVPGW